MNIIPAIDLKDNKAVRLTKGLMNSANIYGNPIDFAIKFEEMGAKWLHIVDLDGAFKGKPQNLITIKNIRNSSKIKIQLGGGIRNEDNIKQYIDIGIDRIILGSIAVKNLEFALNMAEKYKIAIGIDAKNGKIATNGWEKKLEIDAIDFAKNLKNSNVETIICTDINKDGMFSGINIEFSEAIYDASLIPTIASGGFKAQEDIKKLSINNKISGVIIGKAFYENKIDLQQLFKSYLI